MTDFNQVQGVGLRVPVGRGDGLRGYRVGKRFRARFRIPLIGLLIASACFVIAAVRLS
jgi:hypothetical protein